MSDLQGIVVLCAKVLLVLAIFGGGYYFATVINDPEPEPANPNILNPDILNPDTVSPDASVSDSEVPVTSSMPVPAPGNEDVEEMIVIEEPTEEPNGTNAEPHRELEPAELPSREIEAVQIECAPEQRNAMCIEVYQPVCALVDVVCITTPCPPVEQTYGNACVACSDPAVQGYTEGECVAG